MENTFSNNQLYVLEPVQLVDEISPTEIYVGFSNNGSNQAASTWKIKRIVKIGNVWNFEYPNGNQQFGYVWNNRLTYTYSI